jgi:hypothetical protein
MKTSIYKKSHRLDYRIKLISMSCLFIPYLFLLPVVSISIATKSAVASVLCRDVRHTISRLKEKKAALQILLSKSGPNPRSGSDIRIQIYMLDREIAAKEKELFNCMEAPRS